MRFKAVRCTLIDFGAHRGTRVFTFPERGVIGIVGKNGKGKSTLKNSMKLALFGESDRPLCFYVHEFGRPGMPTSARVEWEFSTPAGPLIVTRTLTLTKVRPDAEREDCIKRGVKFADVTTRASLKLGNESIKSLSDVEKRIIELTGLGESERRDAVFVDQNAAAAIFGMKESERTNAINTLSRSSKIQAAAEIAKARRRAMTILDRSDELAEKNNRLAVLMADTEVLKAVPAAPSSEEIEALEGQQRELENARSLRDAAIAQQTQLGAILGQARATLAAMPPVPTDEPQVTLELAAQGAREQLGALDAAKQTYNIWQQLQKQQEALDADAVRSINAYTVEPGTEVPEQEVLDAQEQAATLLQQVNERASLVKTYAAGGRCPTCGAVPEKDIAAVQEELKLLQPQLQAASARHRELSDKLQTQKAKRERYAEWEVRYLQQQQALSEQRAQFTQDPAVPDEQLRSRLMETIAQHSREIAARDTWRNSAQRAEREYAAAKDKVQHLLDQYNALVIPPCIDNVNDVLASLRNRLSALRAQREEAQVAAGKLQVTISTLEQLTFDVRKLEAEQQSMGAKRQAAEFLDKLAVAMHPHAIPHDMSKVYVADLNTYLHAMSVKLRAPFVLQLDPENFGFFVERETGTSPMLQLSGGERMLAAWIWHLAQYARDGGDFGIMWLDEPTVGLDQDNLGNIADAVSKLSALCVDGDLQVFVISHEEVLQAGMSTTVEV